MADVFDHLHPFLSPYAKNLDQVDVCSQKSVDKVAHFLDSELMAHHQPHRLLKLPDSLDYVTFLSANPIIPYGYKDLHASDIFYK
jgi:hypothetical protein